MSQTESSTSGKPSDLWVIAFVVGVMFLSMMFGRWIHRKWLRPPEMITCRVQYDGPGVYQTRTLPPAENCVLQVKSDRDLLVKARLWFREKGEELELWLPLWWKDPGVPNDSVLGPDSSNEVRLSAGTAQWQLGFVGGWNRANETEPLLLQVYLFPITGPYELPDQSQVAIYSFDFAPSKS